MLSSVARSYLNITLVDVNVTFFHNNCISFWWKITESNWSEVVALTWKISNSMFCWVCLRSIWKEKIAYLENGKFSIQTNKDRDLDRDHNTDTTTATARTNGKLSISSLFRMEKLRLLALIGLSRKNLKNYHFFPLLLVRRVKMIPPTGGKYIGSIRLY